MHGPPEQQTGRAMLLASVVVLVLALWMSLVNGDWAGASLWFALVVFFGCYGGMMAGVPERWHRALLIVGLIAGAIAFGLALRAAGIWS